MQCQNWLQNSQIANPTALLSGQGEENNTLLPAEWNIMYYIHMVGN